MITKQQRNIDGVAITVDEVLAFMRSTDDSGRAVDDFVLDIEDKIEKDSLFTKMFGWVGRFVIRVGFYVLLCFFHFFNWLFGFILRRKVVKIPLAIISAIISYIIFAIILYFIYLTYWAVNEETFSVELLAQKIIGDTCPLKNALLNYTSSYITRTDLDNLQNRLGVQIF